VTRPRYSIEPVDDGIASLLIATDEQPYLDQAALEAFAEVVPRVNADDTIRVLLLEGGRKYFSAGASRESLLGADARSRITTYAAELPRLLLQIQVPTVAVMEGHGIGGGLAIGLWCDLAVLAEESLYGANFMALGFTPGMGSTVVLEEALGAPLARDLLFTGRLIKGRELRAHQTPLSYAVEPRDAVRARALERAREIAAVPRPAAILLKANLTARRRAMLEPALGMEQAHHAELFESDETRRTIRTRY
jgi:polyketide biosynthesis enoyl-CoA hydratase PksI